MIILDSGQQSDFRVGLKRCMRSYTAYSQRIAHFMGNGIINQERGYRVAYFHSQTHYMFKILKWRAEEVVNTCWPMYWSILWQDKWLTSWKTCERVRIPFAGLDRISSHYPKVTSHSWLNLPQTQTLIGSNAKPRFLGEGWKQPIQYW